MVMRDQRGTAGLLPIVSGLLLSLVVLTCGLAVGAVALHGRVQSAADLTALSVGAGLLVDSDPCRRAAGVVTGNGVMLDRCDIDGLSVTVAVSAPLPAGLRLVLGERAASARARAEVVPDGQGGSSS